MKLIILFLITVIITAHPKYVEAQPPSESAEELAHEGIKNLMRALRLMIDHIPQYELPVVQENGDIIIKRKIPNEEKPKKNRNSENDI